MKHLKKFFGMMALLLAISCTKSHTEGTGQVTFVLDSNLEIADQTKSSLSQYTTLPDSQDFIITITDASSTSVWSGKIADWDSTTLLKAGQYTVSASYGSVENEGFGKPCFAGSADFVIVDEQTTEVKIEANLANTIVLVNCTDNFKNYYDNYSFKLTRDGSEIVSFAKDDTRAAFVDGYKVTFSGSIVSGGKTLTFSKDYSNLKAATAYTMLVDAANVGNSTITVTFNDTVETIELGDIELND